MKPLRSLGNKMVFAPTSMPSSTSSFTYLFALSLMSSVATVERGLTE